MRDNFFFYNCPTEKSTSKSIFKEIEWKSYFIQKQGCPLPNGNECTYEKAKTLCQTVFGYGIGGKLLQPTTLQINNAVLKTAEDTFCCNYFWIGVSNMDYRSKRRQGQAILSRPKCSFPRLEKCHWNVSVFGF